MISDKKLLWGGSALLLLLIPISLRIGSTSERIRQLQESAEAANKATDVIWTVTGPFLGVGGPQSDGGKQLFLLEPDHPNLRRRIVSKNAFVGCASPGWKVPRAVVEQHEGEKTFSRAVSYREILVDFPSSQPS